jgi:hypothetical protein
VPLSGLLVFGITTVEAFSEANRGVVFVDPDRGTCFRFVLFVCSRSIPFAIYDLGRNIEGLILVPCRTSAQLYFLVSHYFAESDLENRIRFFHLKGEIVSSSFLPRDH